MAVDHLENIYASNGQGTFRLRPIGAATKLHDSAGNLAVDAAGNLFIAGKYDTVLRKLSPDGVSNIVTANANQVAVRPSGALYIADSTNMRIRMISANGVITTVTQEPQPRDDCFFAGLAVDNFANVYCQVISPSFHRIRMVAPDGSITTLTGAKGSGYSGDGGPALDAQLRPEPEQLGNTLAVDSAGNLYVADSGNNAVRVLRPVTKE